MKPIKCNLRIFKYSRVLSYWTPLNSSKHGNRANVPAGVLGQHNTESNIIGHATEVACGKTKMKLIYKIHSYPIKHKTTIDSRNQNLYTGERKEKSAKTLSLSRRYFKLVAEKWLNKGITRDFVTQCRTMRFFSNEKHHS